ncbi:MAG: hypothetical protein J0L89_04595 [Xanthomonadales bacterium]|nr:hypothetical protein [Xanthomonadaceae bacterium]MBN8224080.1 hypothetical protein [Xanthomonadales bacterium]
MRLSQTAAVSGLAAALCLALAACKPAQAPAAQEAPVAEAAPAADAPVADAARVPSLGDDLIVSTNEPFWSARVEGDTLTLSGIDGQRELQVSTSDVSDQARTVMATDATGQVGVTVTAVECQDSMAGATFPFTASLTIDGGTPIAGCARAAWMPPPGEPQ